ncbi:MAG: TIGR01906 family membrane protein [Lachnospiraceae bacterium]
MKKTQTVLAAAAMLFIIIAALLTSFQLAIYGDPRYGFYEKLYEKYDVTEDLHMELSDVMEVTDYMMSYLIGEEEELSIVTEVDGHKQDFFNEQDRLHMADVRNLFLGGLRLRTVLLVLAAGVILLLYFWKTDLRLYLSKAYKWALAVFLMAAAFLGIAFSIDFTACFRIFHEIFFTNDLWMFDPAEDYMIRMLPEGFFSDMVIRIGIIFLGFLFAIWLIFRVWKIFAEKGQEM